MSVRGITAQELPENQDPSVQFRINEVTKEVTSLAPAAPAEEEAPRRRKKKEASEDAAVQPAPEGAGE